MRKNIVYLTGFMGSGKSTIGPILANTLGYQYVDIDKEIETKENRSVKDIFSVNGETYFRELEHSFLSEVSKQGFVVCSLGGGTVTRQDNLELIKNNGVLVYLKTNPEHLFHRLRFKTDRPLLKPLPDQQITEQELWKKVNTLLSEREKYYNQADIVVRTDKKKVGITVDEIVKKIHMLIE